MRSMRTFDVYATSDMNPPYGRHSYFVTLAVAIVTETATVLQLYSARPFRQPYTRITLTASSPADDDAQSLRKSCSEVRLSWENSQPTSPSREDHEQSSHNVEESRCARKDRNCASGSGPRCSFRPFGLRGPGRGTGQVCELLQIQPDFQFNWPAAWYPGSRRPKVGRPIVLQSGWPEQGHSIP